MHSSRMRSDALYRTGVSLAGGVPGRGNIGPETDTPLRKELETRQPDRK